MFLCTVFLTPVSESRSPLYVKCMPRIIWLMCYGALTICPVLVVIINIFGICKIDGVNTFLPAIMYTIFVQGIFMISFFSDLKDEIDGHFANVYQDRQAYYDIKDVEQHLNNEFNSSSLKSGSSQRDDE
jgi:hypothetical protein